MRNERSEIVICGAGIAGLTAAYQLAARRGGAGITLIDEREPFTLTSDKGTQGYRNWWPGPDDTMVRFVSRSIDLLEELARETNNLFRLSRRGYLFITHDEQRVPELRNTAEGVSRFGMGALRVHPGAAPYSPALAEGFQDQPDGADLLLGEEARRAFPFLCADTRAALHVRRAGWVNAPALGGLLLKRALGAGVTFVRDRVIGCDTANGRVTGVRLGSGRALDTECVVLATGPLLADTARLLGIELPIFHELHARVTFHDTRRIVPRWAPFTIWIDRTRLVWNEREQATLASQSATHHLLDAFPGGVHLRPVDGPRGDELYLIWTFHAEPTPPVWPPAFDRQYADLCLRGVAAMMPAMQVYLDSDYRGVTDGGYYSKTADNRALIGPLPVAGAFALGALSGYGVMASQAAGELLALHVLGEAVPEYGQSFLPARFEDPLYVEDVKRGGALTGQL
jgi:glycine/D-amino acid oxidase-like deaminating enzyme